MQFTRLTLIQSFAQKCSGLTISHTDSKSVANISFKDYKIFLLNVMVKEILLSLLENVIKLIPRWVYRENSIIKLAVIGSRENRSDDYSLASECLVSVLAKFPPVSVDSMASSTNTVC